MRKVRRKMKKVKKKMKKLKMEVKFKIRGILLNKVTKSKKNLIKLQLILALLVSYQIGIKTKRNRINQRKS